MVDYETYCRIRDHLVRQQLTVAQTARALALDVRTVARWAEVEQFRAREAVPRASKLDTFKGQIVRWFDAHPYSAQQIYQRLAEAGYDGGITIVKDYVHRIRPRQQSAFSSWASTVSARRFLSTLDRPHAVALRLPRCGQLGRGLAPRRSRPCWAHMHSHA